jgi:hypothetical protein
MTSRSNVDRFGFRADEIYSFIEKHGINLNHPSGATVEALSGGADAREFPNWKHVLAANAYLTEHEAACAFADVDPHAGEWVSDDEQVEVGRYCTLIRRAIVADAPSERLDAEPSEFDSRDNPTGWTIKPAALAAWCVRKRFKYPLPSEDSATAIADWLLCYRDRHKIWLDEAASILAGFKPLTSHEVWGEEQLVRIVQWEHRLGDGMESGQLRGGSSELAGVETASGHANVMLLHADIRTWCAKRGYIWPVPDWNPQPTTDAELAERLRIAEEACANLTRQLAEATASPDDSTSQVPNWMNRMIGQKRIALWDAAKILAGIAPSETPPRDSDKSQEVDEWHYALEDAIDAGEISPPRWNETRCERMTLHAEIRAWRAKIGSNLWPIPDPIPLPTTDAEQLTQRMRALEAERDDLAHRLRTAEAEIARLGSLDETPGYRDITHDRFAPKLAAAIDAWESVTDPQGRHPKQALVKWLTDNAAKLGLWDNDNGRPNKTAIEEAAKVANWKDRGGAPRTPGK